MAAFLDVERQCGGCRACFVALLAALLAIVAARVRLRRVGAGTARPQRAMLAW